MFYPIRKAELLFINPEIDEDNYILDILQYQEDNAHSIIRDFIDISGINWQEIYETIALDVFVGGEA